MVVVPMVVKDKAIGVINVYTKSRIILPRKK